MADEEKAHPQGLIPVEDGTKLVYLIEDAGMDFVDRGLFLNPHETYTVGKDLDGLWAAAFVARNILGPAPVEPAPAPVVRMPIQVPPPPASISAPAEETTE